MCKKLIVVLVLTMGITTLFAQNGRSSLDSKTPEEIADMKTKRMTQSLTLSDQQSESVHQILLNSEQEKAVVRDKYPQLDEAKKEADALRKETQTKVQGVLTADQLKQMKESRRMKHVQFGEEEMIDPDWNKKISQMKSDAGLSDDQVRQLKVIFNQTDAKRKELLKKYPELTEAKKEMVSNKRETQEQLKSVLTEEQYQKWEAQKQQPQKGQKPKGFRMK